MKWPRLVCVALALTHTASAETMAWNIPLALIIEQGVDAPGCKRAAPSLEQPAFFSPSDEIWDISDALKIPVMAPKPEESDDPFTATGDLEFVGSVEFAGEFLLWNQSRQQVVARGSAADLFLIDRFILTKAEPIHGKITLVLNTGSDQQECSVVTRSGYKVKGSGPNGIKWELAPSFGADPRFGDISLAVDWEGTQGGGSVTTSFNFRSDKPLRFASWREGDQEFSASIAFEALTPWGIPLRSVRQEAARTAHQGIWQDPIPLEDGLYLKCVEVSSHFFATVSNLPPSQIATQPQQWKHLIPDGLLDLKPLLKAMGVRSTFAGWHPSSHTLFVVSTQSDLEILELALEPACRLSVSGIECTFSSKDSKAFLISRSGERAHMTCNGRSISTSAMPDSRGLLIDLGIHLSRFGPGADLTSDITVLNGVKTLVGSFDGENIFVTAKEASPN